MPLTVLTMEATEAQGIKSYKIVQDSAMTELIADVSDVLAFKAIDEASIMVTEE